MAKGFYALYLLSKQPFRVVFKEGKQVKRMIIAIFLIVGITGSNVFYYTPAIAKTKTVIKLDKKNILLVYNPNTNKGDTEKIKATVTPAKYQKKLKWKSSNKKIVKVSKKGKVTAIAEGNGKPVKITAYIGNVKAVCKVDVMLPCSG